VPLYLLPDYVGYSQFWPDFPGKSLHLHDIVLTPSIHPARGMAVVSAQPILGGRLLRQSARFAIIDFVRLTYRRYCDAGNGGGLRPSTSERHRRSYRHGSATQLAAVVV
jgi:hypothetical protein